MKQVMPALCALPLLLLGCGSSDESDGAGDPTPDPNALTITTPTYRVESGQEKYMCYTATLPEDRDISIYKIEPEYGKGVHHTLFAWTLVPEEEAAFECPILFKTTWIPLYTGGKGTNPLELPEGAGFKMEKGRQVVLQLHLQNTTMEPIEDTATIRVYAVDDSPEIVGAGIFGMDNRAIDVPPNSDAVETSMDCAASQEMNVFATLPHMHKSGKHIELSRNDAADKLYDHEWNFNDQPIFPLETTIAKGDKLHLSCTHGNATSEPIAYGESSDDEMCVSVLFYTPYAALNGCIGTK